MKKLICAVTVLAVSTAQATTIFVDAANCPGPGDGSVGDPYCSIQTAIDNAADTEPHSGPTPTCVGLSTTVTLYPRLRRVAVPRHATRPPGPPSTFHQ